VLVVRGERPSFAGWYHDLRESQTIPLPWAARSGCRWTSSAGRPAWSSSSPPAAGRHRNKARPRRAQRDRNRGGSVAQSGRTDRLLIGMPAFRVGKAATIASACKSARAQIEAAGPPWPTTPTWMSPSSPTRPRCTGSSSKRGTNCSGRGGGCAALPALVQALRDGACVLFRRRGSVDRRRLPGLGQLIAQLQHELQIDPGARLDHLDLAQWYRDHFGKKRLDELLRARSAAKAGRRWPITC